MGDATPPQVRMASAADAPAIHAIYAPIVESTAISFELEPPTVDEVARRVDATLQQFPWLVCASGAEVCGYAYAGVHRSRPAYQWAVDVSVYAHPQWRGRGVGRALYRALFALLRLQGYHAAFAGIALPNPASVGLHESLGFAPLGVYRAVGYKLGAWHDVGWWQLDLLPRLPAPPAPTPLPALLGQPGLDAALAEG